MATIEDRAIAWSEQHRDINMCNADVIAEVSYKQGAEDQRKMDHSQEHLLWIVNEYRRWCYGNGIAMSMRNAPLSDGSMTRWRFIAPRQIKHEQ